MKKLIYVEHLEQGLAGSTCYVVFAVRKYIFQSVQHSMWPSSTTVAGTFIAVVSIRMIHVKSWHIVAILICSPYYLVIVLLCLHLNICSSSVRSLRMR